MKKLSEFVWPVIGLLAVVISGWLLYKELRGLSLASLMSSLAGIPPNRAGFGSLIATASQVAHDDPSALAAEIERVGADRVAAFFCEPVIGAGGVHQPPAGYIEEVARICRENDVLFVVDAVICGFGRTGSYWGCQTLGIKPDILTCAKALSASFLPISAILIGDKVWQAMLAESEKIGVFGHGFTYSGHPVPAAVATMYLRRGAHYRAAILIERIPGARTLAELAIGGGDLSAPMYLLGAIAVLGVTLAPLAAAAAVRIGLE